MSSREATLDLSTETVRKHAHIVRGFYRPDENGRLGISNDPCGYVSVRLHLSGLL